MKQESAGGWFVWIVTAHRYDPWMDVPNEVTQVLSYLVVFWKLPG